MWSIGIMIVTEKIEVLGEISVLVSLYLPHTPQGLRQHTVSRLYRVFQEQLSITCEAIVSVTLSTQRKCVCTRVLFRTVSEIELFDCTVVKPLIRKIHYVLFNIVCTVHRIAMGRRTNKMHKFLQIIFIFPIFLLALYVSDEPHVHHQKRCLLTF